jgi:nucleoside phosphorylase
MGDVVVADPIFDSGSGKWIKSGETGALEFRPAPYPWRLDEFLRAKLVAFSADGSVMKEIYEAYPDQKPSSAPTVRIDAAASGGSVLQASELVDAVREQHKNLVGIEMESYAVFTAAECSSDPRPTCLSMKAVCDFGDDEKSDDFHDYAAYVSASFFMRFALSQLDFES